jgi:hypothetical protein
MFCLYILRWNFLINYEVQIKIRDAHYLTKAIFVFEDVTEYIHC